MATRGIAPRADGEGSIGTTVKRWLDGWFTTLHSDHIDECAAGHGIVIDGVTFKDGGIVGTDSWTKTTGTFTAVPASTSTLTMTTDMTSLIKPGMALKFTDTDGTKYARVTAITSNLLTIGGAALDHTLTGLWYSSGKIRQIYILLPGFYEFTHSHTKIAEMVKTQLVWHLMPAYCVGFKVYSNVHDSGTTPGYVSLEINGADVCSDAGGLQIAADATWYSTVVNINQANYDINTGEVIEISAIVGVTGTVGNASDLTMMAFFVTP